MIVIAIVNEQSFKRRTRLRESPSKLIFSPYLSLPLALALAMQQQQWSEAEQSTLARSSIDMQESRAMRISSANSRRYSFHSTVSVKLRIIWSRVVNKWFRWCERNNWCVCWKPWTPWEKSNPTISFLERRWIIYLELIAVVSRVSTKYLDLICHWWSGGFVLTKRKEWHRIPLSVRSLFPFVSSHVL